MSREAEGGVAGRRAESRPGNAAAAGGNHLLAGLPAHLYPQLLARLELSYVSARQVLYSSGEPIRRVFFPTSAIFSLLSVMTDGSSVEVATIGREGLIGLPVVLGSNSSPFEVVAQIPGETAEIDADVLRAEIARGGPLSALLLRYTQAVFVQAAQTAACNRLHSVEERCARWLLVMHDRLAGDRFPLTQDFLSQILGVRRASVTAAARTLQKAGIIRYAYGVIVIVDRTGLEEAACECYSIIAGELERLLDFRRITGSTDRDA